MQKLLHLCRSGTPEKESLREFIRPGCNRLSQCWHPVPRDGLKCLDEKRIPAGRRAARIQQFNQFRIPGGSPLVLFALQ